MQHLLDPFVSPLTRKTICLVTVLAVPGDLCDGFDPFDVLSAKGVLHTSLIESLGIPSSYRADLNYFEMTPLGADGALTIGHELVSAITFRDFVISPATADAIDAAVNSSNSPRPSTIRSRKSPKASVSSAWGS